MQGWSSIYIAVIKHHGQGNLQKRVGLTVPEGWSTWWLTEHMAVRVGSWGFTSWITTIKRRANWEWGGALKRQITPFPWLCISYSKATPSKPIQTASPDKEYVSNICACVCGGHFHSNHLCTSKQKGTTTLVVYMETGGFGKFPGQYHKMLGSLAQWILTGEWPWAK